MPRLEDIAKHLGGAAGMSLAVTFIGWMVASLSWALHQEARITAVETSIARNRKDIDILRTLSDRVDRQETPLARRVDQIEERLRVVSDRFLLLEGRLNEQQRR